MPRGIDEEQTGDIELLVADELLAHLVDVLDGDFGGSNVLCYETCLALPDSRAPDVVEQAGLAMVDVTQDADDRLSDAHALWHLGMRISIFCDLLDGRSLNQACSN